MKKNIYIYDLLACIDMYLLFSYISESEEKGKCCEKCRRVVQSTLYHSGTVHTVAERYNPHNCSMKILKVFPRYLYHRQVRKGERIDRLKIEREKATRKENVKRNDNSSLGIRKIGWL